MQGFIRCTLLVFTLISFVSAQWSVKTFVDDFGDKTSEQYAFASAKGTMTNSATVNSPALLKVFITENSAYFTIYDYGDIPITSVGSNDWYTVKMKCDGIAKEPIAARLIGNALFVDNSYGYRDNLLSSIMKSNAIKFYFESQSAFKNYNFTVSCVNSTNAINTVMPEASAIIVDKKSSPKGVFGIYTFNYIAKSREEMYRPKVVRKGDNELTIQIPNSGLWEDTLYAEFNHLHLPVIKTNKSDEYILDSIVVGAIKKSFSDSKSTDIIEINLMSPDDMYRLKTQINHYSQW